MQVYVSTEVGSLQLCLQGLGFLPPEAWMAGPQDREVGAFLQGTCPPEGPGGTQQAAALRRSP